MSSPTWTDLLGQAVSAFVQGKGFSLSPDAVSSIAVQLGVVCSNMVSDAVKANATADANKATQGILNLESAEDSARKPR